MNEQETDVEEGGATLEDKRGRRVGGKKEVAGRYNGDDSGVEEQDDEDVEKNDFEDVDADGKDV